MNQNKHFSVKTEPNSHSFSQSFIDIGAFQFCVGYNDDTNGMTDAKNFATGFKISDITDANRPLDSRTVFTVVAFSLSMAIFSWDVVTFIHVLQSLLQKTYVPTLQTQIAFGDGKEHLRLLACIANAR